MLRSIRSGATKTHIMYRAYMSYSQLKEYLRLLEEKELIKYEAGSQLYVLTDKGLRFMNAYDKINELVPSISDDNSSVDDRTDEISLARKQQVFDY